MRTVGCITETEAYRAPEDRASHAYNHRRTARTETMFAQGGVAYVYLCYGIHEMFNVVTGPRDLPHAVLIRAVEPILGLEHMLYRRRMEKVGPRLTSGPGTLTQAMGIDRSFDGQPLFNVRPPVYLSPRQGTLDDSRIGSSPRVGIDSSGSPWVEKPWRFFLKDSPFVSRGPRR